MSKVTLEKRNIVTVCYRQEENDPDYGSCLWADFCFDLDSYTLSITSDCGTYGSGWCVTPSEPFLKLMVRINSDYLCGNISRRSAMNVKATANNLINYVRSIAGKVCRDMQREIKAATDEYSNSGEGLLREMERILERAGLEDNSCGYDIACCIERTYPVRALKICDIFERHVQPFLRELINKEAQPHGD